MGKTLRNGSFFYIKRPFYPLLSRTRFGLDIPKPRTYNKRQGLPFIQTPATVEECMSEHKRLGECLVKANVINREQLEEALGIQKQKGGFLGQILLEMGWITDKQLCQAISEALHINCVSIDNVLISEDIIKLVPESLAATCNILPLFAHDNILYLAMENPRDTGVIQLVEFSTGMKVRPLVVPPCQLRDLLKKYYHLDEALITESKHGGEEKTGRKKTPAKVSKNRADVKKLQLSQKKRLGDILVEKALISQAQLEAALQLQQTRPGFLGQILIDLGWVTEQEICRVMSESLQIAYLRDDNLHIPPEIVALVPESLAASCNIFPVFVRHNVLYLAMENPLDIGAIQLVEFSTGMRVEPLIAPPSQLQKMILQYYNKQA